MFILLSYIIVAIVIGFLFVWLEQQHLSIVLMSDTTKVTMQAALACVALLLAICSIYIIYRILKNIMLAPWSFVNARKQKQKKKYIELLGHAMAAYLSQDAIKMRQIYNKLSAISDHKNSPALKDVHRLFFPLLSAKLSELTGSKQKAATTYEALANSEKTSQKLSGLHGLFLAAKQSHDFEACVAYAREAFKYSAGMDWANETLLSYNILHKDWGGALEIFKLIEKLSPKDLCLYKNLAWQKALLAAAQAQVMFSQNPLAAKDFAKNAHEQAKTHIGINALYAMILLQCDEVKKALALLESWWQASPHPDYAKIYIYGQKLTKHEQLERAKNLEQINPQNVYSMLAMSEAYLANNNIEQANEYAKKAIEAEPLRRCYLQQMEIEKASQARATLLHEYQKLAKAAYDYAWVGDGTSLAYWQPLSPKTKQLGGVTWQKIAAYSEFGAGSALYVSPLSELESITHLNVDDPGVGEE